MTAPEQEEMAAAFVTASRALIGLAVRSIVDAPVEVTVAQHRVLVLLAARGDLTIGELAVGVGVNPSSATRYCDRLQRLGLVERTPSAEDRRVVRVALTPSGAALVQAVTARRRAEVEKVLDRMTVPDTRAVLEALHAFNRAADELEERDWPTSGW
jgi:DNA-binding MarR family transcriptional regulator